QDAMVDNIEYKPFQKIVCDRKVTHPVTGVNFYRVQGTEGWVFDKRLNGNAAYEPMLYDEDLVEEGLKVYECLFPIAIRLKPTIDEVLRYDEETKAGQLVAIDIVLHSPIDDGNGPYLRLSDGSGWLFKEKQHQMVMQRKSLIEGDWTLRVENAPAGIALRRQPIDSVAFHSVPQTVYDPGTAAKCTHMVEASSGVKFYRAAGTGGWIFDKRGNETMATLLHEDRSPNVSTFSATSNTAWSIDFVRGIAAAVPDIREISLNETSRVISFKNTQDEARINVYYTTRTVGTAITHPNQGKTQLFRRNCTTEELVKVLQDPRVHTGKGYKRNLDRHGYSIDGINPSRTSTEYGQGVLADQEAEARDRVLAIDEEVKKLRQERRRLLKRVRDADLERSQTAVDAAARTKQRMTELKNRMDDEQRRIQAEEAMRLERERQRQLQQQREQELRDRTCQDCGKVLSSSHARWQHWNAVHRIYCSYCDREFSNQHALNQHKDATGHW
ncbi:MAG: hypothetical protein SGILL_009323, partial [Bacillariaceae sp.]